MSEQKPWERLPNETDRAWAAFRVYRDMGPAERSYNRAYQKGYNKPSDALAPAFFRKWGQQYNWVERVSRWDQHLDDLNRLAQEDEARKWRARRRDLLAAFFAKLAQAMDAAQFVETPLLAQAAQNPKQPRLIDGIHIRDLSQAVNMIATQLRNEYDDLPTQKVEQMAAIVGDGLSQWANVSDAELDMVIENLLSVAGTKAVSAAPPDALQDDGEDPDQVDSAGQEDTPVEDGQ